MNNLKCPNCGGILVPSKESAGKIRCPYCNYECASNDYSEIHHIYTDTAKVEEAKTERYKYERMFDHIEHQEYIRQSASNHAANLKVKLIIAAILFFIILIIALIGFQRFTHRNDIQIKVSSSMMLDENVDAVERILAETGFSNIDTIVYPDLTNQYASLENKVSRISINGTTSFRQNTYFPSDAKITLEYHILNPDRADDIKVPGSYYSFIGQNYENAYRAFEEAGFTNIQLSPLADVNRFSKDRGLVSEVYVGGTDKFSDDLWVERSSRISIVFHSTKGEEEAILKAIEEEEERKRNEGNICMPQAERKYAGQSYTLVTEELELLGFQNIQSLPMSDLKRDLFKQNEKVIEVSINGEADFQKGDYFTPDAPVIIKFHSLSEE